MDKNICRGYLPLPFKVPLSLFPPLLYESSSDNGRPVPIPVLRPAFCSQVVVLLGQVWPSMGDSSILGFCFFRRGVYFKFLVLQSELVSQIFENSGEDSNKNLEWVREEKYLH